jgi:hypothetical protein
MFKSVIKFVSRIFDSEYKIKDNSSKDMDKKQKRFITLLSKYYQLGWETTNISASKTRKYSEIHSILQTIDTAVFKIYVQFDSIQLFERSILRDNKSNKEVKEFLHKNTIAFHSAIQKVHDLKTQIIQTPIYESKEVLNYIDSYTKNIKLLRQAIVEQIQEHLAHTKE